MIPEHVFERMRTPVGDIILHHAFAEQALDFAICSILDEAIAAGICERHPGRFNDKLRDLKKAAKKLKRLVPYRDAIAYVCGGAAQLNKLRNILAHGVPIDCYDGPDPLIVYTRFRPERDCCGLPLPDGLHLSVLEEASVTAGTIVADVQRMAHMIISDQEG
ncbi:hypothetical protein DLJ53_16310 [Acuticoccus sediminis]|uniref:Uncharacterized protein n=1 Tax=Acuticoccus sediminis TaxID=2184697 RepID=A0A8B2NUF3_9HYPH|nr:hypothetical protein DLJ53_16310 [Acuticoccus sediminis]